MRACWPLTDNICYYLKESCMSPKEKVLSFVGETATCKVITQCSKIIRRKSQLKTPVGRISNGTIAD